MNHITDWPREAAANLSGGFKRSESIKMLVDKGCAEEVATQIVDELLSDSRKKWLKLAGSGLALALIGGACLFFFDTWIFQEVGKYAALLGLGAFGGALVKLASVWIVNRG